MTLTYNAEPSRRNKVKRPSAVSPSRSSDTHQDRSMARALPRHTSDTEFPVLAAWIAHHSRVCWKRQRRSTSGSSYSKRFE
jgi:ketosteroid isomerase-like protein